VNRYDARSIAVDYRRVGGTEIFTVSGKPPRKTISHIRKDQEMAALVWAKGLKLLTFTVLDDGTPWTDKALFHAATLHFAEVLGPRVKSEHCYDMMDRPQWPGFMRYTLKGVYASLAALADISWDVPGGPPTRPTRQAKTLATRLEPYVWLPTQAQGQLFTAFIIVGGNHSE
jgi:hypothetical protein